jgi:hypothetical protein
MITSIHIYPLGVMHTSEDAQVSSMTCALVEISMLASAINDKESEVWSMTSSFLYIEDHLGRSAAEKWLYLWLYP